MSRGDVGAARIVAFVLMLMAVGLSGCGSSEPDAGAAGAPAGKPKAGASAARAPARPDMVAAVSATKTPGDVDVRFALSGRPAVGQPLDIQIILTPTVDLDRLYARFQAGEGLQLVKGAETHHLEHPAKGTDLAHTVTVIPKSDGIFYVTAVLVTDSPTESLSRTFSIPIIAGAGLPELPASATPPPKPEPPQP